MATLKKTDFMVFKTNYHLMKVKVLQNVPFRDSILGVWGMEPLRIANELMETCNKFRFSRVAALLINIAFNSSKVL